MPDFISSAPGPQSRPSATRHGMVESVPMGYTVSMWPSSRTGLPLRAPAEVHLQVIAEILDAMEFCVAADFLEAAGQKRAQLVHCRFVVAGGFDFHQLADGFGDGVFSLGKETQSIGGFAGGAAMIAASSGPSSYAYSLRGSTECISDEESSKLQSKDLAPAVIIRATFRDACKLSMLHEIGSLAAYSRSIPWLSRGTV